MEQMDRDVDLVIVMPGQITSAYQLPPHRMTKALSKKTLTAGDSNESLLPM